jgi:hypothetical protein
MGRPPKPAAERFVTPSRIIGRVSNQDWKIILAGVAASGKNKTKWITATLIQAATTLLNQPEKDKPPCNGDLSASQELDSHDP